MGRTCGASSSIARSCRNPGSCLINSFSDENAGLTVHPMAPTWPREMLSTTTFEEKAGKTTITITWVPTNATPEEQKTFDSSFDGMTMGGRGTFKQLTKSLAEQQKA